MKLLIDVFGSDCPEALIAGCARCFRGRLRSAAW